MASNSPHSSDVINNTILLIDESSFETIFSSPARSDPDITTNALSTLGNDRTSRISMLLEYSDNEIGYENKEQYKKIAFRVAHTDAQDELLAQE